MPKIIINGERRLEGSVNISGAKNSVLPLLAATALCNGTSVLHNCPNLTDVSVSLKILEALGCKCKREGSDITVTSGELSSYLIPDVLMRQMRSSVMFLGAILGKAHKAAVSSPGGCELGPRPIDLHISSLCALGANLYDDHGLLYFSAPDGIKSARIDLSFPSVGATENIILAAATANGTTIIHNAAKEPEICDLAQFLNSAGAKIRGCGTDTVEIEGVQNLGCAEHTIMPDRIEAVTYMAAAAATGGKIELNNVIPWHFAAATSVFSEAGCNITERGNTLIFNSPRRLCPVSTVRTLVYPGFPTDAGPLIIAMLLKAVGTTVFIENIFQNRYRYIDELRRFGADIKTAGNVAVIVGVDRLSGTLCECTDLRGGAALVVAALSAGGETQIDKICHVERGYENFVGKLSSLGADISLK